MSALYNLTFYQDRFWHMEKAFPNMSGYVLSALQRTKVFDNVILLEKAILTMIKDNDAARLRMTAVSDSVRQYVSDYVEDKVDVFDFSQDPQALKQWVSEQATAPFQIEDSSLFYIAILKTGIREYSVFFKAHHIIGDEWSSKLLAQHIYDNYVKLQNNEDITNQIRYSFLDYVLTEEKYMNSERFLKNKSYWEAKFSDLPEKLLHDLTHPSDSGNPDKTTGYQVYHLPLAPYAAELAQAQVSLLCLALAAFARYFITVKQENDLVFGLPTHNRLNHQEKNTIGMLANSALLRVTLDEPSDHRSIVNRVWKELKELLKNQRYPYPLLKQFIEDKYGVQGHLYQTYISYTQEDQDNYQLEYFIKHIQYCPLIIRINHQVIENTLTFHFFYWEADYSAQDIAQLFDFVCDQFKSLG